ncbi:MAG TPA: MvdD family ATP-grasp ribosomal peptide maturase [Pyrinomonadaceae bacterium]|jgi:MvdD family ATP-grasp ribosomal peptide maturase
MSVLILTRSDDNESIPFVAEAIRERGATPLRFDTDRFPTEVRLVAHYGKASESLLLIDEDGAHDLREVTAIWHRRIQFAARLPHSLDPQLRHASVGETRAAAFGMIASLQAFRMDAVPRIRHAENKQLQLQAAREIGLEIPQTLTTNDAAAVRDFARTCETGMITKMLSSFAIYEDGREKVVFTNAVTGDDLAKLDGLHLCPMTFQEMLPKALELRVTIVGEKVFAAAINSQTSERASHDWRRDGVQLLEAWQHYELPRDVSERLLRLMDYFGLNYGAIDIIVTPDGRHVFLEINPVGEFFWLEQYPGLPISDAIADVLLGRIARRQ